MLTQRQAKSRGKLTGWVGRLWPWSRARRSPRKGAARVGGGWRRWVSPALWLLAGVTAGPVLAFFVLSASFPFPRLDWERFRQQGTSLAISDRDGAVLGEYLSADDHWQFWQPLPKLDPRLAQATLAAEDRRFYQHFGIDPLAALRAIKDNLVEGRRVSGASTLTMQLCRITDQRPRTWPSKAIQAFRALQVEQEFSKDQILEWYLNLAPYGGNRRGVEAGARAWFGKSASQLSLAEAALLAGLPQSPARLRPDRHAERALRRRNWVLTRMRDAGMISAEDCTLAQAEPLPSGEQRRLWAAPHFGDLLRQRYPGASNLRSTLDGALQQRSEAALSSHLAGLSEAAVGQGAIVVLDNRDASLLALVGSRDYHQRQAQGQVNGALAPRSPGSALKPFFYAAAIDAGQLSPATMLADVPLQLGGWRPHNYDHRFRGPVSARQGLADSLNLPAVRVLRELGLRRGFVTLKQLGFSTLDPDPSRYGLTLTLGGAEVNLLDLCAAASTLARGGTWLPPRFLVDEPAVAGRFVFSQGAAWLINDMLADPARLGQLLPAAERAGQRIAWKTGTSYGHRDIWTIAWTPDYTVGVWLGNFDGKPVRPAGLEAAAPLALSLLHSLPARLGPEAWAPPPGVVRQRYCTVSGQPSGAACPASREDWGLVGQGPPGGCAVHRQVRLNATGELQVCDACAGGAATHLALREVWPEPVQRWLRRQQPERPLAPPHNPLCAAQRPSGDGPSILSPVADRIYLALPGNQGVKIPLRAEGGNGRLFWFVNGTLELTCDSSETPLLPLLPGRHEILCADESGRHSALVITIR